MYFLKNSGVDGGSCVCSSNFKLDSPILRGDARPAGFVPERIVPLEVVARPPAPSLPEPMVDIGNAIVPYVPYGRIPDAETYERAVKLFFETLRGAVRDSPPPPPQLPYSPPPPPQERSPPPPPPQQTYSIPLSDTEYFALPDRMRDSFRPKSSSSYGNIVKF